MQDAVEIAVDECIKENILAKFLRENKAEAIAVSIFEYDAEKEMRLFRKAEREVGREEGREEGRQEAQQEVLAILIHSLKKHMPSLDAVYNEITSYETYKNVTKEEIEAVYRQEA